MIFFESVRYKNYLYVQLTARTASILYLTGLLSMLMSHNNESSSILCWKTFWDCWKEIFHIAGNCLLTFSEVMCVKIGDNFLLLAVQSIAMAPC